MKDAVETGWRWDALVLFDPPDIPPEGHALFDMMVKFEYRLADWAKSRPARFADPSEQEAEYANGRAARKWGRGSPRADGALDPQAGRGRLGAPLPGARSRPRPISPTSR